MPKWIIHQSSAQQIKTKQEIPKLTIVVISLEIVADVDARTANFEEDTEPKKTFVLANESSNRHLVTNADDFRSLEV